MKPQGVLIGHRQHEHMMEWPIRLTIEKGTETRKEIEFPEVSDLKGMTILGFYVLRQWTGATPIPSCAGNPLLSLEAMMNAWVTLMGEGAFPIFKEKPLITYGFDVEKDSIGTYTQQMIMSGLNWKSSTLKIDTTKLVAEKEDLIFHAIYLNEDRCQELQRCSPNSYLL